MCNIYITIHLYLIYLLFLYVVCEEKEIIKKINILIKISIK